MSEPVPHHLNNISVDYAKVNSSPVLKSLRIRIPLDKAKRINNGVVCIFKNYIGVRAVRVKPENFCITLDQYQMLQLYGLLWLFPQSGEAVNRLVTKPDGTPIYEVDVQKCINICLLADLCMYLESNPSSPLEYRFPGLLDMLSDPIKLGEALSKDEAASAIYKEVEGYFEVEYE